MVYHDSGHYDGSNVDETSRGLKNESTPNFDISTVAGRLDSLGGSDERANDKGSGFANVIEFSELDRHVAA